MGFDWVNDNFYFYIYLGIEMKMTYAKAGVDQQKEEQAIKSILLAIRTERKKMGKPIDDNQYPGMIEVE